MTRNSDLVLTGPVGAKTCFNGKEFLYFGGTNYLGLAGRPELVEGAREAAREYGTSYSASRETSGTGVLHLELEKKLSQFKDTEDACVYASGYLGNQILLSALCEPGDSIVCDEWAHPSILEAVPRSVEEVLFYPHHDLEALSVLLRRIDQGIVAVNGVETGTGEIAPLDEMLNLLPREGFRIVVDDCHATGVLGENGRGTPEHFGTSSPVVYQTETMSKALGSFGGFIAASRKVCDRIRETTTYVGSTPLPPAVLGASMAAVDIVMREPELREKLRHSSRYASRKLKDLGFEVSFAGTPILFIDDIDERTSEGLHKRLRERGILVPFVHYPTAASVGRLRLIVTAGHTDADIDRLCAGMKSS